MQACIVPVSFPDDRAALMDMLDPGPDGCNGTNLQWLVEVADGTREVGTWTVPRWMTVGDLALFYHAKKALPRIRRHMGEVWLEGGGSEDALTDEQLAVVQTLLAEEELALRYQGHLFACARVVGRPAADRSPEERSRAKHWRSNVYAEISDVRVFRAPMPDAAFRRYVRLTTGGGPTALYGPGFDGVRAWLGDTNRLPAYLARARADGRGFRDVTPATWREVACAPAARFLAEDQLRTYFVDHLLAAVRDPGTAVYEECAFDVGGRHPQADYVVRLGGVWTPVEAKVNVLTEADPIWQVGRYLGAHGFAVHRGRYDGKRLPHTTGARCLLVDADGLYVADRTGFVAGAPGRPALTRAAVGRLSPSGLRARVLALLAA